MNNPEFDFESYRKDLIIEADELGTFRGHKSYIAQQEYQTKTIKKVHPTMKIAKKGSQKVMWGGL